MVELGSELVASGKPKLSGDDLTALKKKLREQSNLKKQQPLFRLRNIGELAQLDCDSESRAPLYISDIQQLVTYSQVGVYAPYLPNKWCQLEKYNNLTKTNILIINGASVDDYFAHKHQFTCLDNNFTCKLEIVSPLAYEGDFISEFMLIPITNTFQKKLLHRFKTLSEAEGHTTEVYDVRKYLKHNKNGQNSPRNIENEPKSVYKKLLPVCDKFPRTLLLLSGWQMVAENFPLPIKGLEEKWPKYVCTKEKYEPVNDFSPMFGIDCEMCMTTAGQTELTRVSIVNEKLEIIYDTLVKPYNRITNYLTQYSGITKKMMKDVKKRLPQVQKEIQNLIPPNAILVGQSLNNDFHALKIMHPYIIDTSFVYNTTGQRNRKTKLKTLVEYFLGEKIQDSVKGHDSNEDSKASLKLVQLKLQNTISFGDVLLSTGQDHLKSLPDLGNINYSTSLFKYAIQKDKKAFVVADSETIKKFNYFSSKKYDKPANNVEIATFDANKEVVQALNNSNHGLNIAHFNVDADRFKNEPKKVSKKINKWVKDVFENSPEQSMQIVIFSGGSTANGCVFIQVKK